MRGMASGAGMNAENDTGHDHSAKTVPDGHFFA